MEDSPRYRTVLLTRDVTAPGVLDSELQRYLRPGDKIVSVYPAATRQDGSVFLGAILELRHPSWAKEGVGWVAGDTPTETEASLFAIKSKAAFEGGM